MVVEAKRLGQVERQDGLAARNARLRAGDKLSVELYRSDPDVHFQRFEVVYTPKMRVLDVLNHLAEEQAPDLAYRWLCGSKMCGTCAVRMNGREVLACWEAVEPVMRIEPLRNLPVIRDLVVDRRPYELRVAAFEPWIEREDDGYPGFPEPIPHRDMRHASKALDCISCMACFSACPVIGLGNLTDFAGPAPLVQLAQTALDPRQRSAKVATALAGAGIFNCVSCYKCEEVCPARIPIVTGVIEPLKRKSLELLPAAGRHPRIFRSIIARRGRIEPSELVLRIQRAGALRNVTRLLLLIQRRKVNPLRAFTGWRSGAARAARRILRAGKRNSETS